MQLMKDAQTVASRPQPPPPAAEELPPPTRRRAWSPAPPARAASLGRPVSALRSRSPAAAPGGEAFPLPSRHAAGRHAKEAVRAAMEEELARAHTFRPVLNAPRRNSPSPQPLPSTREAYLEQARLLAPLAIVPASDLTLHAAQLAKPRRHEPTPQAERDAAELAECTFAPAVGRAPRGSQPRAPAPERLHAEAQRRQSAREQAKRQLEEVRS